MIFEITGVTGKKKGEGTVSSYVMNTLYSTSAKEQTNKSKMRKVSFPVLVV